MLNQKGVYCIIINNKRYIGQTMGSFRKRKVDQLSKLRTNTHTNHLLQEAYNKYGGFEFEILEVCNSYKECNLSEIKHIDKYDTLNLKRGYNILEGGGNCRHIKKPKRVKRPRSHNEIERLSHKWLVTNKLVCHY